jgi:transcriptional regulator with XRE-family HTH domain
MINVAAKKRRVNKKSPEISRFILFKERLGLHVADIAKETDTSERTINNFIWRDEPIGGHLLRQLHEKYHVSLDWLLSGEGEMLLEQGDEPKSSYTVALGDNQRAQRMCLFIKQFMEAETLEEQIKLEMSFKNSIPQYQQFLEGLYDE